MEEMTIKRSQEQGKEQLKVSGSLTICEASLFRNELLEALEGEGGVQVDLSLLTGIDLTGLQLLCSAHQSAEQKGKRFDVVDGGNELFRKVAAEAGFQRHIGCSRDNTCSCIWVEGDNRWLR